MKVVVIMAKIGTEENMEGNYEYIEAIVDHNKSVYEDFELIFRINKRKIEQMYIFLNKRIHFFEIFYYFRGFLVRMKISFVGY